MSEEGNESVLLAYLQMSDFMSKLGEVAYDYIFHLPSDAETELKLMKYTNGFWMRDRRIVKVITIPAQIGGLAPEKSVAEYWKNRPNEK